MSEMPEPTVTAADPMLRILSTEDVSAAHRRNYWMAHAYRAVEARLAPDVVPQGRLSFCGDPDSGQFVRCESSPVQTSLTSARLRAQLSDEHIAICWIGRGNFDVEDEGGMQTRLHAGDLFMFDCGQPMRGAWSDSDAHYLRLPRRLVCARADTLSPLRADQFETSRPLQTNSQIESHRWQSCFPG